MEIFKLFVATALMVGYVSAIDTYYADDYCAQTIDMVLEGIDQGELTLDSSLYQSDCNVTIESWYTADRLMFYFEEFDYGDDLFGCDDAFVTVYDGEYPDTDNIVHGMNKKCGSDTPSRYNGFASKSRYLTFRFFKKDDTIQPNVKIIFTSFHTGYCYSYEYSCSNGRCIDDTVNCNGYDSCGDGTDCELSVAAIVGIVCGSVFVISVCVAVFLIIRRSSRRAQQGQVISPNQQPYGTPAVATGVVNPNFQSSYGAQYSTPYTSSVTSTNIQGSTYGK